MSNGWDGWLQAGFDCLWSLRVFSQYSLRGYGSRTKKERTGLVNVLETFLLLQGKENQKEGTWEGVMVR